MAGTPRIQKVTPQIHLIHTDFIVEWCFSSEKKETPALTSWTENSVNFFFLFWKPSLRCRFPISSKVEFIPVSRNSQTQFLKVENHQWLYRSNWCAVFFFHQYYRQSILLLSRTITKPRSELMFFDSVPCSREQPREPQFQRL